MVGNPVIEEVFRDRFPLLRLEMGVKTWLSALLPLLLPPNQMW